VLSVPETKTGLLSPTRGPAPLLGEHSAQVLGEVLGIEPEEVERLTEAKIVY
jgi:crotonobetainyl-CoA:carnitine CoA-transferase CaiB-like acyl-CoA transferase